jgi:hypothetical protein
MASQFNTSFNVATDKVVRMKEWRQKTKALYKEELSVGEKLFMNLIDKPMSLIGGLVIGAKGVFNKKSKINGAYFDAEHFSLYASGAYLQQTISAAESFLLNKKYQEKINGLAAKGFEQSEDVSAKPIMQRLKPL